MTLSTSRLLLLAGTAWLVAFVLASTGVRAGGQEHGPAADVHGDLSLFTHSGNCVACHNNLVAPSGEDVSIGSTWRSTMMANSARDPYWHAGVRRETIDHPTHAAVIQDECAACHMPMTQKPAKAAGGLGEVFSYLPIDSGDGSERHRLAADGISCSVCHQIAPDNLGTRESFNANFVVAPTSADGTRLVYGPYEIDRGRQTIMRSATGFVQSEAPHVRQSELCATCHTLITDAFGPNGEVIGSLAEQMNYPEWLHSDFNREGRSCQSCHMPAVPGPVRTASVLGEVRERLASHVFVGGNAYMVRLLNRYRDELGVEATPAELEATARATERQLQRDTARLSVSSPQLMGGTLGFDVDVENLTGHKFPTGYPSRRTWLHVTVTDAQGGTVFESGAPMPTGAIDGNDADADPARYEPHYERITRPDEVQIYEPILGDIKGVPTTGLLTATQYLKDNRLLPRGFDKATADPLIGVYGGAARDRDFTSAGDRVRYEVAVPAGRGPFGVAVELLYQTIGHRWAQNLAAYDAAEPQKFLSYYRETAAGSWVVVAMARGASPGVR